MGQILSQPMTDKSSEAGQDERLIFGVSSMQGWRVSMEDSHATVLDLRKVNAEDLKEFDETDTTDKEQAEDSKPLSDTLSVSTPVDDRVSFFAVYDGHGGNRASIFSGENLHNIVACQSAFAKGNYSSALKDGFLSTDRSLLHDPSFKTDPSGCTATTAIFAQNRIYCANAGDSRTVLGVKGIAKPLSFDHKPQSEGERARICAAGGFVEAGRVNGNLALSRAIGDFEFKRSASLPPEEQIVTVFPDVMEHDISPDDEFLILACDGIWDCMDSQAVVEFVRRGIAEKQELTVICENIMENCLAPASDMSGIGCDNMTMMIVGILNGKTKEEWYDLIATRVANGEGPAAPVESAQIKVSHPPAHSDAQDRVDEAFGSSLALQQLLGQSGFRNENGVFVVRPDSAAASLLSNLGYVSQEQNDEDDKEDTQAKVGTVEEVSEDAANSKSH